MQNIMWELWAKNAFALKIAPPAGHFLVSELQGPVFTTVMNFRAPRLIFRGQLFRTYNLDQNDLLYYTEKLNW